MFAIAAEHILQNSVRHFEALLNEVSQHSNPETGHYLERSWAAVFHPLPSECIVSSGSDNIIQTENGVSNTNTSHRSYSSTNTSRGINSLSGPNLRKSSMSNLMKLYKSGTSLNRPLTSPSTVAPSCLEADLNSHTIKIAQLAKPLVYSSSIEPLSKKRKI